AHMSSIALTMGSGEFREQGKVKWSVYIDYARSCNPRNVLIFISFIIIAMFFSVMGNVWLLE
ncbi:hypothetical protein, partial [Serratia marcescens]|uniref:hypothetical protein n=1 Tax=Serratia marcescens TaxID=615 RepID=UPI001953A3EC